MNFVEYRLPASNPSDQPFQIILLRLLGGSLLKSIRDTFQRVVDGNRDSMTAKKLIMYSGHDTTIMALTSLLDVFNNIRVPYATAVIMELFSDSNNKFYFKVSLQLCLAFNWRLPYFLHRNSIPH